MRNLEGQKLTILVVAVLLTLGLVGPARAQGDPANLWKQLAQPRFAADKVASVQGIRLQRDVATITLQSGQLGLSQPVIVSPGEEGPIFAAAFKGSGHLRLAPTLAMERQQLILHTGKAVLEIEFKEAVFVFTDQTPKELAGQLSFQPGNSSELQKLYQNRSKVWTRYGYNWEPRLLKALLSNKPARHSLFIAELNTRNHKWLTLIIDAADPEQVELVQFDSGQKDWSIFSKFPAEERQPQEVFADPLAHHDYRLLHYSLDITVQKNTELQGSAEVGLEVKNSDERVLLFALTPNLRVREVMDDDGQPLAFFQPPDPKDDFFLGDYLVVVSPEPFKKGLTSLRFSYAGKRVVQKMGGDNFFCRSSGWYPTYGSGRVSLTDNGFAGRSDFDLTLRVPKKYQAIAVGVKVADSKDKTYQITQWKSEIPLSVAGFAFGDYKVETEMAGDTRVEIYASKRPDDTFRAIEMATRGPMLTEGVGRQGTVAIGSLSPASMAKEMATEVANSVRVLEDFFGPYPYKKLAVTNIPYSYGQGWPSLLYLSQLSFLDSTQRNALGIRDHSQITFAFRAHETSHQWWGHRVGWKSYHDQWLSEGFAEFSGILYTLYRKDPKEYFRLLRKNREDLLVKDREGVVYEQIGPIYAGQRLSSSKHPGGYGRVVYNKGGWVLHMIRMMLYDPRSQKDFDARFKTMMKDFTGTFHNKSASTEDFKAILEKHMTSNMDLDGNGKMDWFFDSWIYGTGIPHYEFSYTVGPANQQGQFVLKGVLRQSRVPEGFRMSVPIFVHLDDRVIRLGWINVVETQASFEVPLSYQPDKVTINQWEDVLSTVEYK